jgi:hypothetical protein
MAEQKTISENLSGKPKRGRPRSEHRHEREVFDSMGLTADGCERTKMDWSYLMVCLGAITKSDPDTQRLILGCTTSDLRSGKPFPRGFRSAAVSAGRFISAVGADGGDVVRVLAEARRKGVLWRDIAVHYRKLRLGEREGNVWTLTKAFGRTVDEYRKRFPKTTDQQVRDALKALLGMLEE